MYLIPFLDKVHIGSDGLVTDNYFTEGGSNFHMHTCSSIGGERGIWFGGE